MSTGRPAPPKKAGRGPGRPPGSTSDGTRERILQAACECFGKRGYGATTNREIAEHAGITAAAIYQYFDSKSALYIATVRHAHREVVPVFRAAVRAAPTARAALRDLALAHVTVHHRHPTLAPFLSALPVEMQRHPELGQLMWAEPNEVLDMIVATVGRGVEEHEIDEAMGPAVISMYLACTMGLSLYAALIGQDGLAPAVDAYARLLDGALLREPRATTSGGVHEAPSPRPPGRSASRTRAPRP